MVLERVESKKQQKEFLQVPVLLYKDDPNWVRPLDKDVNDVFDPAKNKLFRKGKADRWILKDDSGKLIGRIAAFVNEQTKLKDNKQPTGGCGFFHCINDQEAANLLFDTAVTWLKNEGMEAMDGPINFGDRDKWWGCLVDGYLPPNYCMHYNYPYYQDLFTNYGFEVYFRQYTYARPVANVQLVGNIEDKAKRLFVNPDYSFEHIRLKNLDKYAEDFRIIYNKAWAKHGGVAEMSKAQSQRVLKTIKPVIDERVIWFGYYKNEPSAFFIALPQLNEIFKYMNGKFGPLQKLYFLYLKWKGVSKTMFGLVFGVIPEHQGKGLEAALIKTVDNYQKKYPFPYDIIEMNWIGDFNPKMMKVCRSIGSEILKTHVTYRYLFDRTIPFERMKIIE